MNYQRIYSQLMDEAPSSSCGSSNQRHRIVPGCLGGKYTKSNFVYLTERQHLIAHLLLTKMHPNHLRLHTGALLMMGQAGYGKNRPLYVGLKRRLARGFEEIADALPLYVPNIFEAHMLEAGLH